MPGPEIPPRCVTAQQAARLLCIGRNRMYRLIADGTIATVPVASTPTHHVIALAEIDRIVAAGVQIHGQPGRPRLRSAS